jgi:FtsH-binding integral membrane protein
MNKYAYASVRTSTISDRAFNLILGAVLLYGFAVNWYLVATIPVETIKEFSNTGLIWGYFISCFLGILIYKSSNNAVVSFLGYNLVVVPIGIVLNIIVSEYDQNLVVSAMQVTTMVTFGMIVMGSLFPTFFKGLAPILFWSLLMAIVAELLMLFVFKVQLSIMDWIVAIIFCGYIGFDWANAQSGEKTLNSAVDGAADLYLSIINLFIRILSIMGNND